MPPGDNPLLQAGWSASQINSLLAQVQQVATEARAQFDQQIPALLNACGAALGHCNQCVHDAITNLIDQVQAQLDSQPGLMDANIISQLAYAMTVAQEADCDLSGTLLEPANPQLPPTPGVSVPGTPAPVVGGSPAPGATGLGGTSVDVPYYCEGQFIPVFGDPNDPATGLPILVAGSWVDTSTGQTFSNVTGGWSSGRPAVFLVAGSLITPASLLMTLSQYQTNFAQACPTLLPPTTPTPAVPLPPVATTPLAPAPMPAPAGGLPPSVPVPAPPVGPAPLCPPPVVQCPPPAVTCPPPTVNVNVPAGGSGGTTVIASEQAYLDSPQGQQFLNWLSALVPEADPLQGEPGDMDDAVAYFDQWTNTNGILTDAP